jgi:hypothetical protein
MILHWQGGDHTALNLKINGAGKHRWTVPEDTLSLIRELALRQDTQRGSRTWVNLPSLRLSHYLYSRWRDNLVFFQACGTSRGMNAQVPGPPTVTSSPI